MRHFASGHSTHTREAGHRGRGIGEAWPHAHRTVPRADSVTTGQPQAWFQGRDVARRGLGMPVTPGLAASRGCCWVSLWLVLTFLSQGTVFPQSRSSPMTSHRWAGLLGVRGGPAQPVLWPRPVSPPLPPPSSWWPGSQNVTQGSGLSPTPAPGVCIWQSLLGEGQT